MRVILSNYGNREGDDDVYKTIIGVSDIFGGWYTTNGGVVGDQEDLLDNRDELVDSLMNFDEKLEYGNEYMRLKHLSNNYLSHWVFKHLWSMIEDKLKKKYISYLTPEIIPITICGDKYYVSTNVGRYPYIEFEWRGAGTNEVDEF